MQLTTAMLARFVGGQIRIIGTNYIYRGEIATIAIKGDKLKVTCLWMAKLVAGDGWVPAPWRDPPLIPLETYEVKGVGSLGEYGNNPIHLHSEFLNERITLGTPNWRSNLDRAEVKGLPPVSA